MIYNKAENYILYHGKMQDVIDNELQENTVDCVVTDPPYELGFMGKSWDNSGVAFQKETWERCLRVLKPGGYLLAFGGTRTFHRIACAIEDAGFEIRDTIMWLYGSGFPKSMNIGLAIDKKNGVESKVIGYQGSMMDFRDTGKKQKEISGIDKLSFGQIENSERKENPIYEAQNEWNGWGTALKPAYEPVIVARKPIEKTIAENVMKYGVGGINIDECRVEYGIETDKRIGTDAVNTSKCGFWQKDKNNGETQMYKDNGRYPANVILTYDNSDYNEVCGGMPNAKSNYSDVDFSFSSQDNPSHLYTNIKSGKHYEDEGSVARYFYCAKASKKDRDDGLDNFEIKQCTGGGGGIGNYLNDVNSASGKFGSEKAPHKNIHPTVKPTELMQYLIRLVAPKGATILDPFNGSGSTGKAAMWENKERNSNYKYIGIELEEEYLAISKARIDHAIVSCCVDEPKKKVKIDDRQLSFVDFFE